MMPTPSPVAVLTSATDTSSSNIKRVVGNDKNNDLSHDYSVDDDDDDNDDKISISTATVTFAASPVETQKPKPVQSKRIVKSNKQPSLQNGSRSAKEKVDFASSNTEDSSREDRHPVSTRRSVTEAHPLDDDAASTRNLDEGSPKHRPATFCRDSNSPPKTQQGSRQQVRQRPQQRPPVASLTPGSSNGEVDNSSSRKPSVNFCPIQLSSPDSSIVSIPETTTPTAVTPTAVTPTAASPPDYPTTPPYPPPDDAEFPPSSHSILQQQQQQLHQQQNNNIVQVEALVHAETEPAVAASDEDFSQCKQFTGNQDSGILPSSLGTLPSPPSRTSSSVLAESSSSIVVDSPAVRPKRSSRLQASSSSSSSASPKPTRRRNLSSVSSSSSPPPYSRTAHLSSVSSSSSPPPHSLSAHLSSSLPPPPPLAPNSSFSPLPPIPQHVSPAGSIESTLALSLASPKRRPLLNRPSTSLSAASAAFGKDLFESFEGANYSFDSLPGIEDLNSHEMPHSKKLVNAKEAFQPTPVDSSPTCEVPGWHTSLAQRSLKYLDAPLSSAFEEPPLTFVSANRRGLWGQSGEWDLRTGSGQPVKGPEARSVAAAMAAMLYEEGYSDILPPQVGLNHQLKYPQSAADAPSLVSPLSPSGSLHDNEPDFPLEEEVPPEDVLHTSIVYTGAILPTLHPDMQENLPILPSARDLYENDSSDEDAVDGSEAFRRRRRLPSANFKIFSGPSTPEEPPPTEGF